MLDQISSRWREIKYFFKYHINGASAEMRIRPGDIYEDCSYHPVLCVENYRGDLVGYSLLDGTYPRSCSMFHCGTPKMTPEQVAEAIKRHNEEE